MNDSELAQAIPPILQAIPEVADTVRVEVEDGIAYVEGVVPTPTHRQQVIHRLAHLPGIRQVLVCLAIEHVARLPRPVSSQRSSEPTIYRPSARPQPQVAV